MRSAPQAASVVTCRYNYALYLTTAIGSAPSQSRPPLELIVVDDGSVDASPAIIHSCGSRIRAVLTPDEGHASAIRAGCRVGQGDVVFRLDADDALRPAAIDGVLGRDIAATVPAPWIHRDALVQLWPVPEGMFRQEADGHLVRAIAFLGPVQALDRPSRRYRRHGEVDPENDPVAGDSPSRLLPRLLEAQWRSRRPALARVAALLDAASGTLLPRPLVWRLPAWGDTPTARPGWPTALATWRQRPVVR